MSVLLQANGVSKRFGGVQALTDVSFAIDQGQVYGLIGPNGAGKTTLFNLLTGIYSPDSGSFTFNGSSLAGLRPDRVAAAGIARTFQNIRLFANLSALENVMIGRHVRTRAGVIGAVLRNRATLEEERAIERRALELLDNAKSLNPAALTKSGIICGLGEDWDELLVAMRDLRGARVDILTIGQYLRPSDEHLPIARWYTPDEFAELKRYGTSIGFRHVESGPLVRSSYHAWEQVEAATA